MRRPRLAEVTEGFVDSGGRGGGERGPRRTRSRGEPGTTAGPIRRAGRGLGPGECRRSAPSAGPRAGGGGAAPPRNRRCRPAPRRDRGDGAVTSGRPGSGRAPRGCARGRGCGRGAARLLCSPGGGSSADGARSLGRRERLRSVSISPLEGSADVSRTRCDDPSVNHSAAVRGARGRLK